MKNTMLVLLFTILLTIGGNSQSDVKKTDNNQTNSFVADHQILVLEGVTIIDGTGAPLKSSMSIIIINGKIAAISKQGKTDYPKNAKILTLNNKYVMPGLIEMHGHMNDKELEEESKAMLAFGITSLRIPCASAENMVKFRDKVAADEVIGPRIFTAGELIDGPESVFPFAVKVNTEEQVRQEVRRQAKIGVNYIKLYSSLSPDLVKAAIDEAHSHGLEVIGHLGYTSWIYAASAGIDGLMHSCIATPLWELVPENMSDKFRNLANPTKNFDPSLIKEWNENFDINGPEIKKLTKALVDNKVVVDPTLVVMESFFWGNDSSYIEKLEPEYASPGSPFQSPMAKKHPLTRMWSDETFKAAQNAFPVFLQMIKNYYDKGVLITTGTDAGMPWVTPGVSLHRELELLVQAGIPALEVIKIATRNGAQALRIIDVTGTIEVGKQADLIVLSENPIKDIKNTRKIEMVFLNGKSIDHQSILKSMKTRNQNQQAQLKSSFETNTKHPENKNSSTRKPNIEFVDIPGGTFMMGSPVSEKERKNDETQHEVTVSGFIMSKNCITFEQFDLFCEATGREKPRGFKRGNMPVSQITWYDAKAFAEWMGCRLPTEAEREYATRANTTSPYYTGDSLTLDQAYFNNISGREAMPVGSFPPNAFGLYDMHGNMLEWCSDWYGEYNINEKMNPKGPETGQIKVSRGGGFWNPAWKCRSACRAGDPPGNRGAGLSFRIVKDEYATTPAIAYTRCCALPYSFSFNGQVLIPKGA